MEHRWTERQPADCSVVLELPRGGQVLAYARNISLGGMFVVSNTAPPPLESLVDLEFTLTRDGKAQHHHLPGQIVHVSEDGIGVMFCDFDATTVRHMRDILQSAH
jgi:hypothetical protein